MGRRTRSSAPSRFDAMLARVAGTQQLGEPFAPRRSSSPDRNPVPAESARMVCKRWTGIPLLQLPMNAGLEWTGERLVTSCSRPFVFEHLHRYAIACTLAEGKRVLDTACGEGYGANLLARTAATICAIYLSVDNQLTDCELPTLWDQLVRRKRRKRTARHSSTRYRRRRQRGSTR